MTQMDITRHVDVFSPNVLGPCRIDVIGAGATGSRIVLSLAKLGLTDIHVWDFDIVEEHNIANQAYRKSDVGRLKIEALRDIVQEATGLVISIHNERVDGSQRMGDVVFVLTDTMESRKEIWQKAVRNKIRTKLMIETRMGSDSGRIYSILPLNRAQQAQYEATLYDDGVTEVSACGASISVGPTAEIVSGYAVWQFMRWVAVTKQDKKDVLDNEIIFSLRPAYVINQPFLDK